MRKKFWEDEMKPIKTISIRGLFLILGASIFVFSTQNPPLYGESSLGLHVGKSFMLKEKPFFEESWGSYREYFNTIRVRGIQYGICFQSFPKGKKWGYSFEYFHQDCDTIEHITYMGKELSEKDAGHSLRQRSDIGSLTFGIDFRFYDFGSRKLIPYLSMGICVMGSQIQRGFSPSASYLPSELDVKLGGGVRYALLRRIHLDLSALVHPANSFCTIRAGFVFVL